MLFRDVAEKPDTRVVPGGLPEGSLGYVYLPALGLIVVLSMLAAPFGARLAHRLPVKRLRMVFALMFYVFVLWMLMTLW